MSLTVSEASSMPSQLDRFLSQRLTSIKILENSLGIKLAQNAVHQHQFGQFGSIIIFLTVLTEVHCYCRARLKRLHSLIMTQLSGP